MSDNDNETISPVVLAAMALISGGFLAAGEQAWIEKLSILIKNASLRRRMGSAARTTIEKRFAVDVWLPELCRILESAAQTRRSPQGGAECSC